MCPKRVLLSAALALSIVATPALAVQRTASDGQGNTIRFQVDAPSATITDEVEALRRAPHGAEINNLIIRIVPASTIGAACGSAVAAGCYNWSSGTTPRITIPDLPGDEATDVLLHEYGHHIDNAIGHGGIPEPNGTRTWWAQRRMAALLAQGQVARDYRLGWDRSIGEIFAEDYAQLTTAGHHAIDWLAPPGTAVLNAIRQDIVAAGGSGGSGPTPPPPGGSPAPPATPPSTSPAAGSPAASPRRRLSRVRGSLSRGGVLRLPFTTIGRVNRVVVQVRGRGRVTPRSVRADIICRNRRLRARWLRPGRASALSARVRGRKRCVIRVVNARGGRVGYDVRVRVTSWP